MKLSRWFPLFAGAFAFVLLLLVWGSFAKVPVGSDEAAYLLQARIFASGQLTGAERPLSEFFQQEHVFVDPVLAAKYSPGHSLLLTPGVWLGLPGIVPGILVALTAALLCSLTSRFTDAATGLLAVLLATTAQIALRFNPSYFSELTTTALFLGCWWALAHYWDTGRRRALVLMALAMAWGAITRPYTMFAFALPTGAATLVIVRKRRAWRDLALAVPLALSVFAILPYWNARVTGNWRTLPQAEFSRRYMPSDRLGFGVSAAAPASRLSTDEQIEDWAVRRIHARYTLASLPSAVGDRASNILHGSWSYGGFPFIAIAFAVLVIPLPVSRVVILTILCLFGAYLAYGHDPQWTLYYLELQPALAFLTAAGVYGLARLTGDFARRFATVSDSTRSRITQMTFLLIAIFLALPVPERAQSYHLSHAAQRVYREQYQAAVAALPNVPSIVFVRYGYLHPEARLIDNVPDLGSAPLWTVHDCGADDARLLALAPNRRAYSYRESPASVGRMAFRLTPLADSAPPMTPYHERC